jgi:hypothetical protein
MASKFRETTLTISGNTFTVRTEKDGKARTDEQLEAAHTKAVKQAIANARIFLTVEPWYRDCLEHAETFDWDENKLGTPNYNGAGRKKAYLDDIAEQYESRVKRCAVKSVQYRDAKKLRRPFPGPTYTFPEIPESVRDLYEEIEEEERAIVMARKVIETVTCDACHQKGEERDAVGRLTVFGDEYDLCDEHGQKFKGWLAEALGGAQLAAKSA